MKEVARKLSSREGIATLVRKELPLPAEPEDLPDSVQIEEQQLEPKSASASSAPATPRVRKPRLATSSRAEDESPEVQLLEPVLESAIVRAQDRSGKFIKLKWWNGNGFGVFVNLKRRAFATELMKHLEHAAASHSSPFVLEVMQSEHGLLEIQIMASGQKVGPAKTLARAKAPDWFADEIQLPKNCTLVILDDDPSIHRLWAMRLKDLPCSPVHLRDPEGAVEWYRSNWVEGSNIFWLCDHDLGVDARSGLETIEFLGVQDDALLVTSRFEDPEVQARVIRQGVRILPKLLAPIAPIQWAEFQGRDPS
jgi:hypothetical protein